jgi:hypothetical protein
MGNAVKLNKPPLLAGRGLGNEWYKTKMLLNPLILTLPSREKENPTA